MSGADVQVPAGLAGSAPFAVRSPAGPAEIAAFFELAAATFGGNGPVEAVAEEWRRFLLESPEAARHHLRGAFRDGEYLGGYILEERWLRIGAARLRTGCIGGVVVHPEHRRQGVAGALMRDALAVARAGEYQLLLLHGLADFYDPFGYVDIFDATEHAIDLAEILAQPASAYRVRPATVADATVLLDLYQRHYGPHPGSFERGLDEQTFRVEFATSLDRSRADLALTMPMLAEDETGKPRGYLLTPWGPLRFFGTEVAADDWPALLALLQHQARLLQAQPEPPGEVRLKAPPDSAAYYLLADRLSVRSHSHQQPREGWMACPVDLPGLVEAMLPAWEERWRRTRLDWTGVLEITIGEQPWELRLEQDGVRLLAGPGERETPLRLSARRFTQVIFGFRPVVWAATEEGCEIPAELLPMLGALFPPIQPWIAPSDGC